jgi:Glutamine synthetase adenylyltransferase
MGHWAVEGFDAVPAAVEVPIARRLAGALAGAADEPAFMAALRGFRRRECAALLLRDMAGAQTTAATLAGLSALADACIAAALERAARTVGQTVEQGVGQEVAGRPVVFGFGKLGGHELNFSSDVDLVFAYDLPERPDEETAGWQARLAQTTTRLLAQATPEGIVYRVDTLLRPFGSVGAVSVALPAMADYYLVHGRDWERYALIKARPVAGALAAGAGLLEELQPFVYRRYLDFEALERLREMKLKIAADAGARGREDDLKVGPGGIREVEFVVQLFQLTRGGGDARLRDTRLVPVLRQLGAAGYLPAETAAQLEADYYWLRRCENAVQAWADQQTHRLPADAAARDFVCLALGLPDWESLLAQLAAVRKRVRGLFEEVFAAPDRRARSTGSPLDAACETLLLGTRAPAEVVADLVAAGFGESAPTLAESIAGFAQLQRLGGIGERGWSRLRSLLPELLEEALRQSHPGSSSGPAATRALAVVGALAGRTTYLTLLVDSRVARVQLLRLCAASPWIADELARAPALLDLLLDPETLYAPPQREELDAEFRRGAGDLAAGDVEGAMDLLRRFRQISTLRIAASDVVGALPLVQVSDRLTWLAEVVLAAALRFRLGVDRRGLRRAGRARCRKARVRRHRLRQVRRHRAGLRLGSRPDLPVRQR